MPPARRAYWLAVAAFLVLAMPHTGTGVAWPSLAADLSLPVGELALLIGAGVVGYFVATVSSGAVAARFGAGRLMTWSAWLAAAGLLGQAVAPDRLVLLGSALLAGYASGYVDAGVNTHVALAHGARAMGMLHAGYGVGATAGPLLMTALVNTGPSGWRLGFAAFAAAQLVVAALFVGNRSGWVSSPPHHAVRRRLTATAWWALAVFMLYVGLEVGVGQWTFTLFTEGRGMTDRLAGAAVTGFYAALTAARFLLGGFGHRVPMSRISTPFALLALACILVVWWDPAPWASVAALVACGFGLGPIFPVQMTLTPRRIGAVGTASMVGFQIGASSVGALAVPGLIGLLVGPYGLQVVAPVLAAAAVALVLVDLKLRAMPAADVEAATV